MPGRQVTLPPPAPLRTVLATSTAHGSSIALTVLVIQKLGRRQWRVRK